MHIKTEVFKADKNFTISKVYVDGEYFSYIMEDAIRDKKIYGQTAIPRGTYEVILTWSPRFKRMLPLLVNVPGYAGIRIHPGNIAADTEGCLLPGTDIGMVKGAPAVVNSKVAFDALFAKIDHTIKLGQKVYIQLT